MPVRPPIRLDHVKRTLREVWVDALAGTVAQNSIVWAEQGIPRQARPLVAMQLITGPTPVGSARDEQRFRPEIDSVDVTVSAVTAATRYRLRLNGIPYDFTSSGAPTVTEVRNGLRDLVNNVVAPITKQSEPVTAADGVGPGDLTLTPDEAGAILAVEVSPSAEIAAVVNESPTDCVIDVLAREVMSFQVDVFTVGGVAIELSSRMIAAQMRKALDTPEAIEAFGLNRVSARMLTEISDLTGLEPGGAVLESRAQFDVSVSASSRVSSSVAPIETVEFTFDTDNGPGPETRTITLP
jgi:hypothetical protein